MDLPMKSTEVEGTREDFLEPGGWMWKLLDWMAERIMLVWVWQ